MDLTLKNLVEAEKKAQQLFNEIENKNILIADSPEEFAKAIIKCTNNEDFCNEIGLNAQKLIQEKYSNSNLSNRLISFFNSIQEN